LIGETFVDSSIFRGFSGWMSMTMAALWKEQELDG